MGARARSRPRHRPQGEGVSYSREFLERLARILVGTGHSPRELSREFREICSRLNEPDTRWDPAQLTYLWDLPHVLSFWHSDPQYIDSRGAPIPLSLRGRGASLCALIKRVLPGENPNVVLRSLIKFKGIRRRGKVYVPRARHFTYPTASGRVHGLTALLGMLRTVERNVAGGRKSTPILERTALNPRFPVSELPAFHRRLRATARLGVGIFAFECLRIYENSCSRIFVPLR